MEELRRVRREVFGGWGDELDDGEFALALLAVFLVAEDPYDWSEVLRNWHEAGHRWFFRRWRLPRRLLGLGGRTRDQLRERLQSPKEAAYFMARLIAHENIEPMGDIHFWVRDFIYDGRRFSSRDERIIFLLYLIAAIVVLDSVSINRMSADVEHFDHTITRYLKFLDNETRWGYIFDGREFHGHAQKIARSAMIHVLNAVRHGPNREESFFLSQSASAPPVPPPGRYLRSKVSVRHPDGREMRVTYFRPNIEHLVAVWIAPLAPGETIEGPAFPEEKLKPGPKGSELTVVLEARSQLATPLVKTLVLPKEGSSKECVFTLRQLKPGVFEGTVTVLHRNRVIQTASLSGSVMPEVVPARDKEEQPISFEVDTVVFRDLANLDRRTQYAAAIVYHADNAVTAIANDRVSVMVTDEIAVAAGKIREALDTATQMPDPNVDNLLYACALHGINMRAAIFDFDPGGLDTAQRIQVVSKKPDAYLPIEFCYDGKTPRNDAKVCQDVAHGCKDTCTNTETDTVICPLAFWGLSREIERHSFDPREPIQDDWELRLNVSPAINPFGTLHTAIIGASPKADDHDGETKLTNVVAALRKACENVIEVDEWSAWCRQVIEVSSKASLLLVIGHTEADLGAGIAMLEIGDDKLLLSQLNERGSKRKYIGNGNALAVILGCNTLGDGQKVGQFVSGFRRNGAAVVIGTTTAVLGRHATPLAKALVEGLTQCIDNRSSIKLGTLMRELRMHFIAQDIPIGLATVAFGDADWTFGETGTGL